MKIKNSVILITGSADRLGKATAYFLAQKGAKVVIHYHTNSAKARKTAEEIGKIGHAPLLVEGDLTVEKNWLKIRKKVLAHYGKIDVLVNNAAIFYPTPFFETTGKQWDDFMQVNLKSVFWGSKIVGETMMARKTGKIINIADISTERVWAGYIPYCVSKAGVVALTKGLAKALAPHITVNAIAPGAILEPEDFDKTLAERLVKKTPLKRFGTPQDIAGAIAFLIESGDYITGTVINVDGGQSIT